MMQFGDLYRNRRVLVTGHTGFKGSWLTLWLHKLGANVTGIALDPDTQPNHWDMLNLNIDDNRIDIRDTESIQNKIKSFRPEIIFHLAAQPLVRRSYQEPLENWSVNVMGTANILEACRQVDSVKAIVAVTSDKVYANQEKSKAYKENDRLGGHDPYSASKAACEILIDSYRKSFFDGPGAPLLASARAGNVIGGGDWSVDRLIPDIVRSLSQEEKLIIRSPHSTRPWQHVLDCLAGYLQLGTKLLEGNRKFADAWNFGPGLNDNCTVSDVLNRLKRYWPDISWIQTTEKHPHEATLLHLNHEKASSLLDWQPAWDLEKALETTAEWYRSVLEKDITPSLDQLSSFIEDAHSARISWVTS